MSSCDIGRQRDIIYELSSRVVSMAKLRALFGCIRAWGSSVACNRVPRSMHIPPSNLGLLLDRSTTEAVLLSLPCCRAVCAVLVSVTRLHGRPSLSTGGLSFRSNSKYSRQFLTLLESTYEHIAELLLYGTAVAATQCSLPCPAVPSSYAYTRASGLDKLPYSSQIPVFRCQIPSCRFRLHPERHSEDALPEPNVSTTPYLLSVNSKGSNKPVEFQLINSRKLAFGGIRDCRG
jgi:hypothetical protein